MSATKAKPRRINFTKQGLDALSAPLEGRYYTYDTKQPGLTICTTAAGTKTFYLYKKHDGKPERVRLGTWPQMTVEQARNDAKRETGKSASGINPNDEGRVNRQAPTLGQVFDEFITKPRQGKSKKERSPKTIHDYKLNFKKHLEHWRNRQLSKISRRDINDLHDTIGEGNGKYIANRTLALLKAILNFAVVKEYFAFNPAANLRGFEEESRDRILSAEELPKLWAAIESEPSSDFWKIALFTGARRGNVAEARWEDIDLKEGLWRIPKVKGGKGLTIPLAPVAISILKARKATATTEWVFPDSTGSRPMPFPRWGWDRILTAAGLDNFRPHDLRRSLASWQASQGSSETVVGASLGHKSIAATKIYLHATEKAVRDSVTTATAAMLAAVTPKKAKGKRKGGAK